MQKPVKHIVLSIASTVAILLSCKHKDAQAAQIIPESKKGSILALTNVTDTVALAFGNYSCNCIADPAQKIILTLSKNTNGYMAALTYKVHHISGVLHKDTVNYDKDFNVWSFKNDGKIYGFRFSKSDSGAITVALINEDYKKEFESCSDAKVIDFIKH
jgi:hypothetical protein